VWQYIDGHGCEGKESPFLGVVVMKEAIRSTKTGEEIGWVENDRDVYNTRGNKFATRAEDGKVYSLDGQFLGVYLTKGLVPTGNDTDALATFLQMAEDES
jgi:hypothetical protein